MPPDDLRGNSPPVAFLAGPTGEEWRSDETLGRKLSRYATHRRRADAMLEYIAALPAQDHQTRAAMRAMDTCARALPWRYYYEARRAALWRARTCKKHLLCPFCATRRASRAGQRYQKRVQLLTARDPGLRVFFVTLTVKNGPDLSERFNHVHGSMRTLRKRVSRGNAASEFSKAVGAVWSFEAKRGGNSREWHPHVHGLWVCDEAIDLHALRTQWHAITGDSFVVDAREVDLGDSGAFLEVFKYALKFSDLPLGENYEAWRLLRGRNLIACSGELYGVHVPDEGSDDEEQGPYYPLLFRYEGGERPVYRFAGHVEDPAPETHRG